MDNPILLEDLDYIYNKLSPCERQKLVGATVLITGCAGFLGYSFLHFFVRFAERLGVRHIIGLDNFMLDRPRWLAALCERGAPVLEVSSFDIITGDIASIARAQDVDYVMHMASIASPTFYRKYPIETLDANVWGLRRLLNFYADKPIKGFLFFSSSEIYGDPAPEHIPTDEEYRGNVSCIGPRACYDEAKRFGETMCYLFAQKYNLPITIARPFNNYGPGMSPHDKRVPADFARAIIEGRDIEIFSDGTPTRTFCYVADAVAGYLKVLLHGKFDYFNIGMDKPEVPIRELGDIYVEAARQVFDYRGKLLLVPPPDAAYLAHNPNRRCPNIQKARNLLGFDPEVTIRAGVERFLRFLKHEVQR
jgi:UDP-glucuronate decarboxylase